MVSNIQTDFILLQNKGKYPNWYLFCRMMKRNIHKKYYSALIFIFFDLFFINGEVIFGFGWEKVRTDEKDQQVLYRKFTP